MKTALPVNYISHPLLTENCIESRIYQQKILNRAIYNNTLVVLPAGMGKTVIATLLIAYYLNKHTEQNGTITTKCIFLTPTKPLVIKRSGMLKEKLSIPECILFSMGNIQNIRRVKLFHQAAVLVMTPNVLLNDLNNGLYDLEKVSLIVFDECHRATGEHDYVKIPELYFSQQSDGRLLGLTTSLGNKKTAEKVCENLRISTIEGGTTYNKELSQYHPAKRLEWRMIPLPRLFQDIRTVLENQLYTFIEGLNKKTTQLPNDPRKISIKQLVELQTEYQNKLLKTRPRTKIATSLKLIIAKTASCIRLLHLIERIETQGLSSAKSFVDGIRKRAFHSKKELILRRFYSLKTIKMVQKMIEEGLSKSYEHPKVIETVEIVKRQLSINPDSRILIFANYRASVKILVDTLNKINNKDMLKVSAASLVGHLHQKVNSGLSFKQQMKLLKRFEEGLVNVIVATSVAEQGLDIIDCDLVVFYDCVPDLIRSHQRCSRTGTQKQGRVIILITKGTADERYYWVVKEAEKHIKKDITF